MDINEDIISRFENAGSLEGMTNELFTSDNIYMNGEQEDDSEPDDIIILHMDIREPLRTLKTLLEQKIGVDLKKYTFWLQDAQILEPHKNLVDQCVKGEGLVQINVQIQTIQQRINIVDVLKPTDAALAAIEATVRNGQTITNCEKLTNEINVSQLNYDSNGSDGENTEINNSNNTQSSHDKDAPCLNWVLDSKFKKEQARLEIPEDPNDWSIAQVKHWFRWAVRQFNLSQISLSAWNITGAELCALTHKEFRQKVPKDPGNVFWTHLQLLKECKFVSVIHKLPEVEENGDGNVNMKKELKIMRKSAPFFNGKNCGSSMTTRSTSSPPTFNSGGNNNTGGIGGSGSGSVGGNSSLGNNGQVQLWQFLLEILTDREHKNIIQWVGADGEFKLTDPEKVARLWGEKKNKPAMNYEKLSRALRYYYDGDMISKVSGKRFAYKFDCDLKLLIGYNAEEISKLVNEKNFVDESIYMDHNGATSDDE